MSAHERALPRRPRWIPIASGVAAVATGHATESVTYRLASGSLVLRADGTRWAVGDGRGGVAELAPCSATYRLAVDAH